MLAVDSVNVSFKPLAAEHTRSLEPMSVGSCWFVQWVCKLLSSAGFLPIFKFFSLSRCRALIPFEPKGTFQGGQSDFAPAVPSNSTLSKTIRLLWPPFFFREICVFPFLEIGETESFCSLCTLGLFGHFIRAPKSFSPDRIPKVSPELHNWKASPEL